ncbi:hypothetical protein EMIHUDRAFT_70490 [Emiliania huxleyi CCMP1516]|uniref:MPN domain-containing protein n=2 Tax=Emiliania huxleyi TaxID=2903 RepID=A0A0D3J2C8_EMIH1|nr:hypothetical protein EMIHUDRAFT_75732 [Emiliania huxleyi CCMP1516]XP_005789785.1 hypothetical protein EMIHUDRAFT_70490 [Emiliania huxleyi CCMP1516]EOD17663.1 hypothetical protein EMIHUDRAFT_75732 [Emiliania huxleyi CCMP1516]EOD37356.1 hypothetical protein EMIHUDRAFT_70490 [Emiliania huxleyi CCMP1516]|eukprot:XP_005770092.1 hypothetical protein EMIHUDRAFT_75732 [Emiliania huxleyi CCMP1516]
MAAGASSAQARFELENDIRAVDAVYTYDNPQQQKWLSAKPWTRDPRYFKNVRISALALIKMVMHARGGGTIEVMGLMQGKIDLDDPRGPTLIVLDAFALPVEATETRVNAMADAYEYMVEFQSLAREAGRAENVIGWYHSHPGYGCWLSGIDVNTQMLNQQFQEPWLAVVIDPTRTASTGRVEIGAFRTYPQGYKPPEGARDEFESVPLAKIEDFGAHQDQYYQLEISFFKSASDTALLNTLWNKYWVATLSSSPILANAGYMTDQLKDLADKVEQADGQIAHFGRGGSYLGMAERAPKGKDETQLKKLVKGASKLSREHVQGMMQQILKDNIFNKSSGAASEAAMDTSS